MEEHSDRNRQGDAANRRFGTGRSFEDVLSEVYRHTSCLTRDLERAQSYLERPSRERGTIASSCPPPYRPPPATPTRFLN